MQEEIHIKVLRILEDKPDISQRDLAVELGISLGKANYCLKALLDKGWIKARNFKNSNNKRAYAYLLTPSGIRQKALITARFLQHKLREYEELETEIELLKNELKNSSEHSDKEDDVIGKF
ncbi:MAG TPA: MarR family EPS-associated transcriptional regulator [Gammaproteobacteria bacterium]|nr:MarR family EPS-associated transcriptional regulator [Gammaproteobacteria bacterium]